MKKIIRILAMLLSLVLTFALFACDAGYNKAEGDMDAAPDGFLDGMNGVAGGNTSGSISGDSSIMNGDYYFGYIPTPDESPEYNAPEGKPEGGEPSDSKPDEGEPEDPNPDDGVETNKGEDAVTPLPPVSSLITSPFVNTEENRFSTFSADVDTASYTYFRKLVGFGYGINELRYSADSFRTEEFINYFRYDVKGPSEGELFGVTTTIVPCPWNEGSLLFRATLQTEAPKTEAPNNLVFLIDVSGSMSSADKLPLLKKAFSYLVSSLKPTDTVSIVTYSGREEVVLDGCKGNDPERIMNAINSLAASGSTNGEAGLKMAYQIAEKHMSEGSNNRIIMASDGDLNVGISSATELKKFIEEKRDQGVYLSVLGFGTGNYRDDKMESLADNGNGVYYYIDGESEAEKVFGTDLCGTLYTVANDVKLQIEFDPDHVESYRLIGYDNRILDKEDFENDAKDAGEVGASHQVTVCYEIVLKPSDEAVSDYMTLRVRYKNPGEPVSRLNEYEIGAENVTVQADDDTRFIASVIELVSLIRNPQYEGDVTVESILAELQGLELADSYKAEFRELVKALAAKK